MRAQADASGGGLTCMLGEVVRLQRLPLAELLAAPVAALSAGALAGAGLCGLLEAGREVVVRLGG